MKLFNTIRAWLRRLFRRESIPAWKQFGYSGCKSRPHAPRKVRYIHVSDGGRTYRRAELRRHEMRALKKRGLDLTGQTGTRTLEGLL